MLVGIWLVFLTYDVTHSRAFFFYTSLIIAETWGDFVKPFARLSSILLRISCLWKRETFPIYLIKFGTRLSFFSSFALTFKTIPTVNLCEILMYFFSNLIINILQNAEGPFDDPVRITSFINVTDTVAALRSARNSSRSHSNDSLPKPVPLSPSTTEAMTNKSVSSIHNPTNSPSIAEPRRSAHSRSAKASWLSVLLFFSSSSLHLLNHL